MSILQLLFSAGVGALAALLLSRRGRGRSPAAPRRATNGDAAAPVAASPDTTVAAPQDVADHLDRVLAVEEGDQVEQRTGQHRDLVREAGGIPQRDTAPPFVLDRKGLDRPKAWIAGGGHSASR